MSRKRISAESPHAEGNIWSKAPLRWLVSLHIGILILILLIIASIYGTLLTPLEKAQEVVYYSWWYKALLLLLVINMGAATLHRIFYRILPASRARYHVAKSFYLNNKPSARIVYSGSPEAAAESFRKHGFAVSISPEGHGCARKGFLGHWGAPISHAGIVVVLLAGFLASWTAQEGYFAVEEGGIATTMILRTNPPREVPLGFTVRCEDFETGFFPRTRIPASYISTVTILDDRGTPLKTDRVEVNHTVKTHGWTLHQTSYEEIPSGLRYVLAVRGEGMPEAAEIELSPGQSRPLPSRGNLLIQLEDGSAPSWKIIQDGKTVAEGPLDGMASKASRASLHFRVEQFEPDFVIGPDRRATSRSSELNNPALRVGLYEGDKALGSQWLFVREDLKGMMPTPGLPYRFDLLHLHGEGANRKFHLKVEEDKAGSEPEEFTVGLGESAALGPEPLPAGRDGEPKSPEEQSTAQGKIADGSGWSVSLDKTIPMHRTILTVTRNPVIPVIYGGCAIIMMGLLISFFSRRKTIFFWVDPSERALHAVGIYRHHQDDLDRQTRRVLAELGAKD